MYKPVLITGLALGLVILSAGCDLFSPQTSKATIEVSTYYYTPSGTTCTINVNLDGGPTVTVSNGSLYTFPLVNPGTHTVNFSFATNICGGNTCSFNETADSFPTKGSSLYVVKVAQGGSCNQVVISGP